MKNFNQVSAFMQPVINPDRGMQELPNMETLANWRSYARKFGQELNVVEKRCAKRFCGGFIVGADVVEEVFEIS
jgi:hypothetical protein